MTAKSTAVPSVQPPLERYRRAERRLWDRYSLEPTERFIELESPKVRLRVVEVGSGKPVLFVSGTGGTGPYWAPLVAELPGFRCLLLDRPGYGFSSVVDYSRHEYKTLTADLLTGVLDALGIDRISVVGHSIGNAWALGLVTQQSSRVERVVLLGGSPLTDEVRPPTFIRLLASPLGAIIVRLPESPRLVQKQLRGLGHGTSLDSGRIPDEFIAWHNAFANETNSLRNERKMVFAVLRKKDGWTTTFRDAELAAIGQRVLLVYGTADPTGSVDIWERFVGRIPEGELKLLAAAGHLPWLDDPDRVGGWVSGFLAH
jgi:2-hydroxy-6-oxonona-2,4-dienedioate hydrolase